MKKLSAITLGLVTIGLISGCNSTPDPKPTPVNYSQVEFKSTTVSPEARRTFDGAGSVSKPEPSNQAKNNNDSDGNSQPASNGIATQSVPVNTPRERIRITAVGYGTEIAYQGMTPGQVRLMAIRASKLDAYRALAEQLYGINIDSNTSVASLATQNDSFRARVNAMVRGARVISITPMADNNYETVLEVFVDRRFFDQVFVYQPDQAMSSMSVDQACGSGMQCIRPEQLR
ncbi:LPP20 family lipoprotein [Thiomicrospira sp. ALE5]|uniref:LPP20 family lipoprotein n=1 Tax=Thiomicrospira sp. ALE5 TaxID=748650 RepID=UPI0008E8E1E2|nr:LPP20 family lipoprotein [Thiomicrospira sp. ALE5]SFR53494.1 hypothetical protein SAMN03092900_0869 [Thiomicrospira sp. ALE5]